ncbi:hypothetical protein ASPSYDRAFT_32274 [Aspergillus sydowii CBS 593.65]|uniref:RRM domain-containing protein n=1 Tax=Aspergillus sydowii CBS 593.65 TaxID=1036612 RepID=A0A1L9TFZ5_9EURO|nr:uncharacterized protein ASPSYDRAFT_32274 [Aspergillus sydowii CBS 593.65]OJJ58213.1 hypothetical protein ASPSYDRAFT_32274 [Aspergillus sydowii CBS 593.65]
MDRSLDEIIAERPRQNRGQNRGGRNQGRRSNGVKKPYRDERVDLDLDWVHDKYEDDRDTRPSRGSRRPRGDRYSPSPERGAPSGTRLRIENLHYDITETDLEELFCRIGSISNVSLVYDRAGRSEGVAYVTYARHSDARTAIAEFDGANAKGQPIRISITSSAPRRGRNPFDNVEKPKGSLFDRVERPGGRDARSLSPTGSRSESAEDGGRRRRGRRGGANYRRSDVSKPAPEHIDRYIPGQRSPVRRGGGGRRQGGENRESRRGGNPRPKKTQEELDQEMEDYWGSGAAPGAAEEAEQTAPAPAAAAAEPAAAAPAGDDDIDMIE